MLLMRGNIGIPRLGKRGAWRGNSACSAARTLFLDIYFSYVFEIISFEFLLRLIVLDKSLFDRHAVGRRVRRRLLQVAVVLRNTVLRSIYLGGNCEILQLKVYVAFRILSQ